MFARRDSAAQERIHSNPPRVSVIGTQRQCVWVTKRSPHKREILPAIVSAAHLPPVFWGIFHLQLVSFQVWVCFLFCWEGNETIPEKEIRTKVEVQFVQKWDYTKIWDNVFPVCGFMLSYIYIFLTEDDTVAPYNDWIFCSGAAAPYMATVCDSLLLAHVAPLRGSKLLFTSRRYWPAHTMLCLYSFSSMILCNELEKIYHESLMKCSQILMNDNIWECDVGRLRCYDGAKHSLCCPCVSKRLLSCVFFAGVRGTQSKVSCKLVITCL